MFRLVLVWMMSLASLTVVANAQSPDIPEPGSVEAIAAATTDPHFVSPWVSYVPQSNTVPSPEKFLGRIMGAPGELLGTEKTYAYARALAAASPRVRVFTIGHSEEGRGIVVLAIADEAGIRDLDRLKTATAALADPRAPTPQRLKSSLRTRVLFITSTPRCIPTKPARPRPWLSLPTDWRCRSSL